MKRKKDHNVYLKSLSKDPLLEKRKKFLGNKLDMNPEKFWRVVSKYYQSKDDGESETTTIDNIASQISTYVKVYEGLKG